MRHAQCHQFTTGLKQVAKLDDSSVSAESRARCQHVRWCIDNIPQTGVNSSSANGCQSHRSASMFRRAAPAGAADSQRRHAQLRRLSASLRAHPASLQPRDTGSTRVAALLDILIKRGSDVAPHKPASAQTIGNTSHSRKGGNAAVASEGHCCLQQVPCVRAQAVGVGCLEPTVTSPWA
jgi:hypothetical protein